MSELTLFTVSTPRPHPHSSHRVMLRQTSTFSGLQARGDELILLSGRPARFPPAWIHVIVGR